MKLYIKNMVCPRCIMAVRTILISTGLTPTEVNLGEAEIAEEYDPKNDARNADQQSHPPIRDLKDYLGKERAHI